MPDTTLLAPMMFDTRELPLEHQFEAWRAYHSNVIDVSSSPKARDGFMFEQHVWDLGKLAFTSARLPGTLAPRNWRHLRKDPLDHWCIVLPESGFHIANMTDNASRNVFFRSLAGPFEGMAVDSTVSTLFIPRDLLRNTAGALDAHSGILNSDGLGGLFGDFMCSLQRRLPAITVKDLPYLVEAMRTMITACLVPSGDNIAAARETISQTVLERARLLILRDLYSPVLGPTSLCLQLGISRSKLYFLFEPLGGVGHYIRRRRLLAAHHILSDSSDMRTIGELAKLLCFSDTATFSRAFRSEFGCTPSDIRATIDRGEITPPPNPSPYPPSASSGNLASVLRHLQI